MVRGKTFLVGVDDSDSSIRSVSYVAEFIGAREDFHVVLFHVLPRFLRNFWNSGELKIRQQNKSWTRP
jgi:hypothetical protein